MKINRKKRVWLVVRGFLIYVFVMIRKKFDIVLIIFMRECYLLFLYYSSFMKLKSGNLIFIVNVL